MSGLHYESVRIFCLSLCVFSLGKSCLKHSILSSLSPLEQYQYGDKGLDKCAVDIKHPEGV